MTSVAAGASAKPEGNTLGRVVLVVLAFGAGSVLLATPAMITPFPESVPWYESAASFPRLALGMVMLGAVAELLIRRKTVRLGDSDELDSSTAQLPKALAVLALFVAYGVLVPIVGYLLCSVLFLTSSAKVVGLSWRAALSLAVPLSAALWAIFKFGLKISFGHSWLI